jgi:hypothetical protein
MKRVNIEDPGFRAIVAAAGMKMTSFDDGVIWLEVRGSYLGLTAPTSPAARRNWYYHWCGAVTGTFFIVGREAVPPLKNLKKVPQRYAPLSKYRAAQLNSTKELQAVLAILIEQGTNVDHDVYAFSSTGGWLLYVSHHDEIQAWIPIGDQSAKITRR